jgi:2-polyprenyl-3-methyl-5-hydroxy-6-metoxy-1,4-benzoquinol methylase
MRREIYKKEPCDYINDIPIFIDRNNPYVINYEKISQDHLKAISEGIENPWIKSEIWEEMENSTLFLISKYIDNVQSKSIKILDIGVGLGRILQKIKNTFPEKELELYGIDISISYLSFAKTKGIEVACSNVEDLPYKDGFFDIIICTDVLEHVVDINASIKEVKRVLKDGGYLFVRVPNKEDLSQYLANDYPYYFVHLRSFDRYSLELLFTRVAGMKCIEICDGPVIESRKNVRHTPLLVPSKVYYAIIIAWLNIVKLFSIKFYEMIKSKLFHPIEINGVFTK